MYIPVQLSIHVRVHVPVQPAAPPPPMRMSTAVATHPSYSRILRTWVVLVVATTYVGSTRAVRGLYAGCTNYSNCTTIICILVHQRKCPLSVCTTSAHLRTCILVHCISATRGLPMLA
eukprot:COSAG01_NODE_1612_length_9735_cov_74.461810_3_plen_118_part_00